MGILSSYEPTRVFQYFEEIAAIPHGSGNTTAISNYLVDFAKSHGLKYRQDEMGNVIIWKAATAGYEERPTVIIQGHMDMVAVKEAGCSKNLETEGLDLEIDGDYISARATSLGGDDGIALAYALALLESDDISHPALEVVITVDEEVGMLGAGGLDTSDLRGKIFINIDSEDEGIFTVSCAGGQTDICNIPIQTDCLSGTVVDLKITGLQGGHSGVDINKGKANANKIMARLLANVLEQNIRLVSIDGGEKDNAIPRSSESKFYIDSDFFKNPNDYSCLNPNILKITNALTIAFDAVKKEYADTEPDINMDLSFWDLKDVAVIGDIETRAIIDILNNCPNGVQNMDPDMPDMVQTSLNLGIIRTEAESINVTISLRSSIEEEKAKLHESLQKLFGGISANITVQGKYPGWQYRNNSLLRNTMVDVYESLYGKKPVVEGIHAGLECGIFASKIDDLDCISFGPQMYDIHTTNEKLSISSTERNWQLLLASLKKLGE